MFAVSKGAAKHVHTITEKCNNGVPLVHHAHEFIIYRENCNIHTLIVAVFLRIGNWSYILVRLHVSGVCVKCEDADHPNRTLQ